MPDNSANESQWMAIPADLRDGLERLPSKRKARLWLLVLQSQGIPCRLDRQNGTLGLFVPAGVYQSALAELRHFELTNRNWPPPAPGSPAPEGSGQALIWILLGLAVFHFVSRWPLPLCAGQPCAWIAEGNALAGRILTGEWWRTLTALTLHADSLHLLGNLLFGGLIVHRLGQLFGTGLALLLVLLGGAAGNYLNALLQAPDHRSIGASTAVFAAIGVLAVVNTLRYRHSLWRRWPLPLAAALGLLAILGVGAESGRATIDIGAHLTGFCCGTLIGLLSARIPERPGLPATINMLFGLSALLLVLLAWRLALAP